jgi:hypothetical protein
MTSRGPAVVAAALVTAVALAILAWRAQPASEPAKTFLPPPTPTARPGAPLPVAPGVSEVEGPLVLQVGESVDADGLLVGVPRVAAPYQPAGGAVAARGQFLLVDVEAHNSGDRGGPSIALGPGSFELRDDRQAAYQPVDVPGAQPPPWVTLQPGETVSGELAYDVPRGRRYRLLLKAPQLSQGLLIVDLGAR